ncbi:MAG: adenosylcobalamin-dependent ribonucleoside-diphosphate reductase [Clostridia bacterium]|jgi:ribonucleoside-diphosphate reductase alpha chain|nr:adenosylcobalamin-dependent ribonucleoside-diphosphate reductase [Clostridia bacterium]
MNLTPIGDIILRERYLQKNIQGKLERSEDLFKRVADAVSEGEENYPNGINNREHFQEQFFMLLNNMDFLPNSPTLLNAGTSGGQLASCFVLPLENNTESIFETLKKTAVIHSIGGGTGFSLSNLYPRNSLSENGEVFTSGPIALLELFNHTSTLIRQGGVRPGANMANINVEHPDILEFIRCKKNNLALDNFNLSVALTDEFMKAVAENQLFSLRFNGKLHKKILARKLLHDIAANAWANGEPGIIFIDTINRYNPIPALGRIEATNPCGEQPLLPYEACNLGSINLVNMISEEQINWNKLKKTVSLGVRFLDNVIDVNKLPYQEISSRVALNRKIGLGVMGFANFLQLLNIPYDHLEGVKLAQKIMRFIQFEAHQSSAELAKERGNFPNINKSIYKNILRRNATCTTIAPTGTISSIAGISPGIEPSFALAFTRKIFNKEILELNPVFMKIINSFLASQRKEILEYLIKFGNVTNLPIISDDLKRVYITATEIKPENHLGIQAAFQQYCDNAVSKTINLPEDATIKDIEKIICKAYMLNLKGVTVYRIGSRKEEALREGCPLNKQKQFNQLC